MHFVLLLLCLQGVALLPTSQAWLCGKLSECQCRKDFWVICSNVQAAPNFRPAIRRQRSLMITVSNVDDFNTDSLDLTRGFKDTLITIGTQDPHFCHDVIASYPWIRCAMTQTTSGCTTEAEPTDPTAATTEKQQTPDQEIYSINLEARVTFGLEKVTIGSETKSLVDSLKPWLKSPSLFWSCVSLGVISLAMILVITFLLLVKKRRSNVPLGVKCLDWICKLCLCPCKCLDKLRSRERPLYRGELPMQQLPPCDSSESVELYNASKRNVC